MMLRWWSYGRALWSVRELGARPVRFEMPMHAVGVTSGFALVLGVVFVVCGLFLGVVLVFN